MSLYKAWKVFNSVKIPIIGGGGISNSEDAIEFILAGASAVSLGTINLAEPKAGSKILAGIKNYMRKHKIEDIRKLKGAMNV